MLRKKTSLSILHVRGSTIIDGVRRLETETIRMHATREKIFESRLDETHLDQLRLTARFRVRGDWQNERIEHVVWRGQSYRLNRVTLSKSGRYSYIEIGEAL